MSAVPLAETDPWLTVIGIGEDGLDGLSPARRAEIAAAEVLIGGARHLAMIPEAANPMAERLPWPSPLKVLVERIHGYRGRRTVVLATGDPMCFGIGTTLGREVPLAEMRLHPAPSAHSLVSARMGWPLDRTRLITLHGRPLSLLALHLQPGARLVLLSADAETPGKVATYLTERGWGPSQLTVLEHMGGSAERRMDGTARDWTHTPGADLNAIALVCAAGPEASIAPPVPGLPDSLFRHDGQLTKAEVRAATLAALGPGPGQILWDVGAGSGSIGIEWLRSAPHGRAIGIEPVAGRRAFAMENAEALGVPMLEIVEGRAPDALEGLPAPDAVFIGGGISTPGLVERCWEALRPGGRLVANVVTLEGETALAAALDRFGGEMARTHVERLEKVGPYRGWRSLMGVTRWRAVKPLGDGA